MEEYKEHQDQSQPSEPDHATMSPKPVERQLPKEVPKEAPKDFRTEMELLKDTESKILSSLVSINQNIGFLIIGHLGSPQTHTPTTPIRGRNPSHTLPWHYKWPHLAMWATPKYIFYSLHPS